MRPRSPIEMMVDSACGFDPQKDTTDNVTLRCPGCRKTKRVARESHDMPGTAVVETECPDCIVEGTFPEVLYFDAAGRQIIEPPSTGDGGNGS